PQFKLVVICNKLPSIPSNDGGTWRRIRVVAFESKFVDNPDKNNKLEFSIVRDVDVMSMRQAFIWLLLNKYCRKIEKNGKIHEPKKVIEFTNTYRQNSDLYMEFIEKNYANSGKKTDTITLKDAWLAFKNWYNGAYGRQAPVQKDFYTYMRENTQVSFDKTKDVLWGYVLKME